MSDAPDFVPSPAAFAVATDARAGGGLTQHRLPGTAQRVAPSPRAWSKRPDGRGISQ
jgi:hypothetical protein